MKKVLLILLLCLFTMSVFATSPKEKKDEGKVIIFQSKVEITDALSRAAKDFTAETGIPVEIWETTGDDYRTQLKLKLTGDEVPTVFSVSKGAESEEMKAYLASIEGSEISKYISEPMSLKINGKHSGVPYGVEGFGVVTNDSMLKDSDFASQAGFFAAIKRMASNGVNPFGLSQESYFLIMHILNTPFAMMDNPEEFLENYKKGGVRLSSQKPFQAFAQLMELIRDNCVNPMEINYDRSCGDFATGKTAMIHQGNWCYGMFDSYNVNFNMSLRALPLLGNDRIAVSVPYHWVVNSQASEKAKENSIKFIDWLYTSEKGKNYILKEFGFVPATSNIETDSLNKLSADVAKAAASGKTLIWSFNDWGMGIDTDLAPVTQRFFTTPGMSGIDFVNVLDDAFQAFLKK